MYHSRFKVPLSHKVPVTLTLAVLATMLASASQACTIKSSACYPWRIEADAKNTTLLEIVPNNEPTNVIYRICLCPPAKKVSLIFDFQSKEVTIGSVEVESGSPICRDFRIATTRKSRILLSRPDGVDGIISGCYVTE